LTVVDLVDAASVHRRYGQSLTSSEIRQATERRLRREVLTDDVEVSLRVSEGPITQTIVKTASEEGCDVIVLGISKNEAFRRIILGSTVDSLVRRSPVPVLVVQNRPRSPYRSVVVPSDFQAPSRRALETAADFFPSARLSVFHAFDIPYSGIAGVELHKAESRKRLEIEAAHETFVGQSSLSPEVIEKVRSVVKYGPPAPLLSEYVLDKEVDLVALATHGRHALLDFALAGVAQSILEEVRTDVLVVRKGVGP
jgi:nucleotide-binding universal stress UspA family protein